MKLSDKLSLYIVCTSIGIFIAIAFMVEFYATRSEAKQGEHITRLLQTELAGNLENRLYTVEQNVKRTVKAIQAGKIENIKKNAPAFLDILLESDSIIEGCSITFVPDSSGNGEEWMEYLHWDGNKKRMAQLGETDYKYTERQWYNAPLQSKKGEWSQPYDDQGGGECLMLTYAYPVKDASGRIVCEVTADIALSMLDKQLHHLIPYAKSYSFTLTKDGRLLDGYPMNPYNTSDRQRKKDFTQISESLKSGKRIVMQGTEYICTFTPMEDINLVICTASPKNSIRSVTTRIRLPLLLILTAGFIILILTLRITLKRTMKPLNRLTKAAIDIGNGNLDTEIPQISEYADLQQLRDAMAYMTTSIRRYIAEIEESTRAREQMATQLRIASDIQRSLLPPAEIKLRHDEKALQLHLYATQECALEVGGDLYDYVVCKDSLYFIMADVSGKGIPAALMMSYVKSLFHFAAQMNLQPSEIASRINDNMCADNQCNMFVTFQVGCIDTVSKKLVMSNAGHNPAVMCHGSECLYLDLPPGLAAGIMPGMEYTQHEFNFSPGCSLFLYTDGASEAEDADGVLYGQDHLLETVSEAIKRQDSPASVISSIADKLRKYCGNSFSDDLTMLCISASIQKSLKMNLDYERSEIERLSTAILDMLKACNGDDAITNKTVLVAEEAVSNIINHSLPDNPGATIDFEMNVSDDKIDITIADKGPRFNPLSEAPEVDTTLSLDERKIGGLGIFLIRKLSDSISYDYHDKSNYLKITIKR